MSRRRWTAATAGLTAATAATGFLPWAATGQRHRSGYTLAHTADRLGLAEEAPWRWLVEGAFAVPAIAGVVWVGAALGRRWPVIVGALLVSVAAGAGIVAVARTDLELLVGPTVAGVTATLAVATAGVATLLEGDSDGRLPRRSGHRARRRT